MLSFAKALSQGRGECLTMMHGTLHQLADLVFTTFVREVMQVETWWKYRFVLSKVGAIDDAVLCLYAEEQGNAKRTHKTFEEQGPCCSSVRCKCLPKSGNSWQRMATAVYCTHG